MKIHDYESGRALTDIDIVLSRDEVEELTAYLHRLLEIPDVNSVQLSRVDGFQFSAEVSVSLEDSHPSSPAIWPNQSA